MKNETVSEAGVTNVVGYLNGNDWPVHVAISKLNVAFTVEAKTFATDSSGANINDPVMEAFVGERKLTRETAEAFVPVRRIGRVPVVQPDPRTIPVRQGTKDANGRWQPSEPKIPVNQPPPGRAPILAMSMEEARARGYVGKARLVPEDYGADINAPSDGRRGIPPIKLSLESQAPLAKPGALPPQAVAAMADDPTLSPANKALAESLATQDGQSVPYPSEPAILQSPAAPAKPGPAAPRQPAVREVESVAMAPAPAPPKAMPPAAKHRRASPPRVAQVEPAAPVDADPPTQAHHVCRQCGKSFPYFATLQQHVQKAHSVPPPPAAELEGEE